MPTVHARNVEKPGERPAALTPDEWEQAATQRKQEADERDVKADERDQLADERDVKADERDRELLSESATARLQARLETMPVIEQAKGVIMHQNRCTEEQAFDWLRKTSQRSNVPVRELAVRIVASYQPEAPKPRSPKAPTSRRRSQHPAP
jgi:ANTAR domain-containing protein